MHTFIIKQQNNRTSVEYSIKCNFCINLLHILFIYKDRSLNSALSRPYVINHAHRQRAKLHRHNVRMT